MLLSLEIEIVHVPLVSKRGACMHINDIAWWQRQKDYMHPCASCFHVEFFASSSWRDYKYYQYSSIIYIYIYEYDSMDMLTTSPFLGRFVLQTRFKKNGTPISNLNWGHDGGIWGWAGRSQQYFSPLLLLSFSGIGIGKKTKLPLVFFFQKFFKKHSKTQPWPGGK